jgi:OPA family glycerol-3-phosphate transporter-like MFS transporter
MQDRRRRWENTTVATLFSGYAGYYVCRSNLSVAGPLMLDELGPQGFDKADFGAIASFGVVAYAGGKVLNGILADRVGGRALFLGGMFGSVAMTVAFGLAGSFAAFAAIWALNRLFQSMGWVALVKVSAAWFPVERLATIMGLLSASFLIGDAIARGFLGLVVEAGAGWRGVFQTAAGTLLVIALIALATLRASPTRVGLDEPAAPPRNVFGQAGSEVRLPLRELLRPLLESPIFWLMCAVNFGLTLLRETFNTWNPIFLHEVAGFEAGSAGIASLVFPAVGGVAAIVAGRLSDLPGQSPARVAVPFLVLLVGTLAALAFIPLDGRPVLALLLLAATAFFLIGPYSFMTGVMAIDLGGKAGSATVAGLVDAAGYVGGIASGWGVGQLAQAYGWTTAFGCLAVVGAVTIALAVCHRQVHTRSLTPAVRLERT